MLLYLVCCGSRLYCQQCFYYRYLPTATANVAPLLIAHDLLVQPAGHYRRCSRLFLLGLEKYGKGDWRSISRNFVVTRTPTQVASHAQKFFIRLNSGNKDRRRSSIHDITTVGHGDAPMTPQMSATISTPGNSGNQSSDQSAEPPGVGVYGTAIGHPVVSGLVTAIGTPVTIPVPGAPQMAYGVQAPVTTETVVPEDPINFTLRSRSTPRKSAHR